MVILRFYQTKHARNESKHKAKISNRYNQVPHLTWGTICEMKKIQENMTHRRPILQLVITRLQGTDKAA